MNALPQIAPSVFRSHAAGIRLPGIRRVVLAGAMLPLFLAGWSAPAAAQAQAAAAVPAPARQLGTVESMNGRTITVVTAAGAHVAVPVAADAVVLQLPPGETSLKSATPAAYADIAVGDRIVTGKAGDSAVASRVILMKSSDIAALKQSQQADWQRRGSGGIVRAVDGPVLSISSGARSVKVETTPTTIFRRYADDSVDFGKARASALSAIQPGDQMSVRGTRSDDGTSIVAEEVVSGTFENLSGSITAVDAAAGTVTLKDLISKKPQTIHLTANSDIRKLPPAAAAAFAARGSGPGTAAGAGARSGGAGAPPAGDRPAGAPGTAGERPRNAGMDLSKMLARLPAESIADLHVNDAVMIVATQGTGSLTAITVLSGVEQILSATPSGAQPITLSPWSMGAPEGGGATQ